MTKDKRATQEVTLQSLANTVAELFEFLQENMATKDDLKNYATKDDLKNFATKDDLKNFATKDDLENNIEKLRLEMQAGFRMVHNELDDIKASLKRLEQKTQEDDDALLLEVSNLKKRVKVLEHSLAKLEKQKAIA